jgi:hypothetical protein
VLCAVRSRVGNPAITAIIASPRATIAGYGMIRSALARTTASNRVCAPSFRIAPRR